jgi:Big-like domain-containing protein
VPLALGNPLNRVEAKVADPAVATIDEAGTVVGHHHGRTTLTLTYQRKLASGAYNDVYNGTQLVTVSIPICVKH